MINYPQNHRNQKLFFNYVFPAMDRKPTGCSERLTEILEYRNVTTYNKLKLMYPNFPSHIGIKCDNAFELLEHYLNNMPSAGMLTYDEENPVGALTF